MTDLDMYDKIVLRRLYSRRFITPDGCWLYTGKSTANGYATVRYAGKMWSVHRLILYILRGNNWNPKLNSLHICNNKKCFNPDHLYFGSHSDNLQDFFLSKKEIK